LRDGCDKSQQSTGAFAPALRGADFVIGTAAMKFATLFLALTFTAPLFAADNELSAEEKAAGWKLLFDGKSTAGWTGIGKQEFPAKGWVVADGALKHEAKGGGGDIVTTESFENFELVWDWKVAPVGNSGIKYNLPDKTKGLGFEYQMLDDEKHPDGVKGGRLHQTAGLYDLIEPAADKKTKPVGEWNTSRIVVNGAKVEHWLNGAKTLEFEMSSVDMKERIAKSKYKNARGFGEKTASPILIQDHGDEVSVKNMKLRAIK
jgi:hypothetical protein